VLHPFIHDGAETADPRFQTFKQEARKADIIIVLEAELMTPIVKLVVDDAKAREIPIVEINANPSCESWKNAYIIRERPLATLTKLVENLRAKKEVLSPTKPEKPLALERPAMRVRPIKNLNGTTARANPETARRDVRSNSPVKLIKTPIPGSPIKRDVVFLSPLKDKVVKVKAT
jgi:hypothetical protein